MVQNHRAISFDWELNGYLLMRNRTQGERNVANDAAQVKAEFEKLRAENEALKKTKQQGLTLKVSEKGGVSIYGLGRCR